MVRNDIQSATTTVNADQAEKMSQRQGYVQQQLDEQSALLQEQIGICAQQSDYMTEVALGSTAMEARLHERLVGAEERLDEQIVGTEARIDEKMAGAEARLGDKMAEMSAGMAAGVTGTVLRHVMRAVAGALYGDAALQLAFVEGGSRNGFALADALRPSDREPAVKPTASSIEVDAGFCAWAGVEAHQSEEEPNYGGDNAEVADAMESAYYAAVAAPFCGKASDAEPG